MNNEWTMQKFMKGAVLLTIAALIVKALSAVYRIPFQNIVGDQGFYIYQQVYPFIGVLTVWTSYGFAVAISKLLADAHDQQEDDNYRATILRIAFIYLSVISIISFTVLFSGADVLARWMGDDDLAQLLRTGSFVVLLMPVLAVLKGSFQSQGRMEPVAYGQVVEQTVRVTVILIGTFIVVKTGASLYTAGSTALLGAIVGEIAGIVLLLLFVRKKSSHEFLKRVPNTIKIVPIVKNLTVISLSVSMSSLILLFFQLVDSFTVFSSLLETGMDRLTAMETKGMYDRGLPLVQMGILIASTLSLSIVPLIAHTTQKKTGRTAIPFAQLTFKIALLFGTAATLGLILVLSPVNEMLFETRDLSTTISVFCIQIFWLSLILTMTSMLQGLGKVIFPAILLIIGLIIKLLCNAWLLPKYGIMGAAVASNIGFIFIAISLYLYLYSIWKIRFAPARFYGHLAVACLCMIVTVMTWIFVADSWLFDGLSSRIGATFTALTSVGLGAVVFLLYIAKSRIIAEKEWFLLPLGRRMAMVQLWLYDKNRKR
ncbi:putative polysaccharide biosynthesis protein [Paenisporosarcina antarctica]|uniref:Polysaccharide biosynthesis protein n=1 Tax=Paenisporosarcina antarctica TaxID=417367 RepID=A0A4P7A3A3_9BACL|nr:polysaccharide biosynthesis protein [Paenisporosarcina antarctica]QBP42979.1 polysaccharide biosynthesis protein [Paenisporosarcina antarctica]